MPSRTLAPVVLGMAVLLAGCAGEPDAPDGSDDPDSAEVLPPLKGCRAYLTGTLRKQPLNAPAPSVFVSGSVPVTGIWTEEPTTQRFVPGKWVAIPCGSPLAAVTFTDLRGEASLSSQIRATVPPSGTSPGDTVFLWPNPPVSGDPLVGPQLSLEAAGDLQTELIPKTPVSDICKSDQVRFPVSDFTTTATVQPPPGRYEATSGGVNYQWLPDTWTPPKAPFELEDVEVIKLCHSNWAFGGSYQLTYDAEMPGIAKARAQHDFWIDGELALVDETRVEGFIRLYDIEVTTSGDVTGSYTGPTEVVIPIKGFYEPDAPGSDSYHVDLPIPSASGVTWSYTLKMAGAEIAQTNSHILDDHLKRWALTVPPSPDRANHFRLAAQGQELTKSFSHPEGFVIASWGLQRRAEK